MNKPKVVCLIPARGGSKRIPKKNIKAFHGKPLIAWSITAAKESRLFDDIYISTDCDEIAAVATQYGGTIPFRRPAEFADDFALDEQVRSHFLNWADKNNIQIDYLCYLYATAPFITPSILHSCFELLKSREVSSSLTITSFPYPVFRSLSFSKETDNVEFIWSEHSNSRSQDLPDLYHDAGQCYFFDLASTHPVTKRAGLILPRHQAQDIDTMEDFIFAEKLFIATRGDNNKL